MPLLLDTSVLIDARRLRHRRRELAAELVQAGPTLATTALILSLIHIYRQDRGGLLRVVTGSEARCGKRRRAVPGDTGLLSGTCGRVLHGRCV